MSLQQPNTIDSPDVLRGGWRAVTLEEVRSILADAELDLDEQRTRRFLDLINGQIFCIGGLRQAALETLPRRMVAQRFEEVQRYAKKLRQLLKMPEVRDELQCQWDIARGFQGQVIEHRNSAGIVIALEACGVGSSVEARVFTQSILNDLTALKHLSAGAEARATILSRSKSQPKKVQDLKTLRAILVVSIASCFESEFGYMPRKTRATSWCSFLAGIMSCCEGKELGCDGAHELWIASSPKGRTRRKK